MGRIQTKRGQTKRNKTGNCDSFHIYTVCCKIVNGLRMQVAQPQGKFVVYTLIYVWKQYFQLWK